VLFEIFTIWAAIAIEEGGSPGRGIVARLTKWDNGAVLDRKHAVASIPARTCVEADNGLVPHLTPRNWVTMPGAPDTHPDFIVLDTAHKLVGPSQTGKPGANGPRSLTMLRRTLRSDYQLVGVYGSVIVFRAPDYAGPRAACAPLGSGPSAAR
jgi:hypothetical protein